MWSGQRVNYELGSWGFSMKRFRRAMIILGAAAAVALALAVPPMDVPETSFDEADTPVNQTTPVVLQTKFVAPVGPSVIISRSLSFDYEIRTAKVLTVTETSLYVAPHSLLYLLRTLLC